MHSDVTVTPKQIPNIQPYYPFWHWGSQPADQALLILPIPGSTLGVLGYLTSPWIEAREDTIIIMSYKLIHDPIYDNSHAQLVHG